MDHKMGQIKKITLGILPYVSFFLAWTIYIIVLLNKELHGVPIKDLGNRIIDLNVLIVYIVLVIFYFNFSLIFSRLDNINYIPHNAHYTVSRKKFIKSNFSLIVGLNLFFIASIFIISNSTNNLALQIIIGVSCVLLTTFLLKLVFKEKIGTWIAFISSFFPISAIFTFSYVSKNAKEYVFIATTIFIILLLLIYFIVSIAKLPKISVGLLNYLFDIIFSEYNVSNQAKRHDQNIALLESLYANLSSKQKESNVEMKILIKKLKNDWNKLFLKTFDHESTKNSSFLDLMISREFDEFILRLIKHVEEDYKPLVSELEKEYYLNEKSHRLAIMNVRTENIKLRNIRNLIVSFVMLAFTMISIIIVNFELTEFKSLVFLSLIAPILLRLILRGFEIARSFYIDLTISKFPESFLTGTDRIYLAVKSIMEVVLLSSSIYLLCNMMNESWKFSVNGTINTIFHAFSVSMFNISYSDDETLLIYQFTHIIQVIVSVILITIGISGYMNRIKYPIYFESEQVDGNFIITKNTLFKYDKDENDNLKRKYKIIKTDVIKIDLNNISTENKIKIINREIEKEFKEKNINEEEFDYFINVICKRDPIGEHILKSLN